jgi:tetratricopeptide (TPR) repeat protein
VTLPDAFGLDVTAASPRAVAAFDRMTRAFLAHGAATPAHLAEALAEDPDFALALACRGLFCLTLGRRELVASAADAAAAARRAVAARGATARERLYLDALQAWLDGRPSGAVAAMDAILARWPQDALAFKIAQAARFMLGDQAGMRRSVEAILPQLGPDHPALGYVLGCRAFTLEEAGAYSEAERAGRRGLELAPDDAWGLHAVAHVYDMTARSDAGVAFLAANAAAWAHCNNFRYHVWWHLALLHLDRGDTAAALALYDAEVRRDRTDDYRDIANATSLLMRLELEGVAVGARWEELAELCAARVDDGCLAFADLHYLLALTAGGREEAAGALTRRMHLDALRGGCESDVVMRRPGLALAKGLQAFAAGRHAEALAHLRGSLGALPRIGGSHAQRDVFERIAIEAAIRAGALAEARAMLVDRDARRGARDGFATARGRLVDSLLRGAAPARNRLA